MNHPSRISISSPDMTEVLESDAWKSYISAKTAEAESRRLPTPSRFATSLKNSWLGYYIK